MVPAARWTPPSRTRPGRWHSRRHRTDRVRVRSSARGLCWQAQAFRALGWVGFGGQVEHGRTRNRLHRESSHSRRDARVRVMILLLAGPCVKIRLRQRLGPVRRTMCNGRARWRPSNAHRVGARCEAPRLQRGRDFDSGPKRHEFLPPAADPCLPGDRIIALRAWTSPRNAQNGVFLDAWPQFASR